jgi:hypothetical protein
LADSRSNFLLSEAEATEYCNGIRGAYEERIQELQDWFRAEIFKLKQMFPAIENYFWTNLGPTTRNVLFIRCEVGADFPILAFELVNLQ